MLRYAVKLYQTILGITPKRFDTVDIPCAAGKFIITVAHSEMRLKQSRTTPPFTAVGAVFTKVKRRRI